jgi:hypothetical protein
MERGPVGWVAMMSIGIDLLGGYTNECADDGRGDVPRRSRQLICVECSNEHGDAQATGMTHFRP